MTKQSPIRPSAKPSDAADNKVQGGNEFDLIAKYFAPLATDPGAFALRDDAACIRPPAGMDIILTTDTLAEHIHYLPDTPSEQIARKLFSVNLSDLAAKGARPHSCLLHFSPAMNVTPDWIAGFAAGVKAMLADYHISLLGGDSVALPQQSCFSLTLIGLVEAGRMVKRATARIGDDVYISGTIGKGYIGLQHARQGKNSPFRQHYLVPQPRLELGVALAPLIHAAIDISDGLVGDLTHLCEASSVGMEIDLAVLPYAVNPDSFDIVGISDISDISDIADESDTSAASAASDSSAVALDAPDKHSLRDRMLTGGDDYELAFTASPDRRDAIFRQADLHAVDISLIGQVVAGNRPVLRAADGAEYVPSCPSWQHFA